MIPTNTSVFNGQVGSAQHQHGGTEMLENDNMIPYDSCCMVGRMK